MEFDLPLWYPLKVDLMVVLPTAEKMVLNWWFLVVDTADTADRQLSPVHCRQEDTLM